MYVCVCRVYVCMEGGHGRKLKRGRKKGREGQDRTGQEVKGRTEGREICVCISPKMSCSNHFSQAQAILMNLYMNMHI